MTFLIALLLCLPNLGPADLTAYATWDRMRWEYDVPPISLIWAKQNGDVIANQGGFDAQGRAIVYADPILRTFTERQIQKTALHEAIHAMLRAHGVPIVDYSYEDNLANSFAYCTLKEPNYYPFKPCPEVFALLRPYHR